MSVQIILEKLNLDEFCVNAMSFIPDREGLKPQWAIFTHGYTAHKGDMLNWAQRLSEAGVPTIIFDLPGHYLGSYNEVSSFEKFVELSPSLFSTAFDTLQKSVREKLQVEAPESLIFGGHSLGALLSLLASELDVFSAIPKVCVGVGIGAAASTSKHLFETVFYRNTLNVRRQLVSSTIGPDLVFPWVRDQKNSLKISGKRVHLITGEDDAVVGAQGMETMAQILIDNKNEVTWHKPKTLPHHQPAMGAAFIYSFLKEHFGW